jgi:hypothetical protein
VVDYVNTIHKGQVASKNRPIAHQHYNELEEGRRAAINDAKAWDKLANLSKDPKHNVAVGQKNVVSCL